MRGTGLEVTLGIPGGWPCSLSDLGLGTRCVHAVKVHQAAALKAGALFFTYVVTSKKFI